MKRASLLRAFTLVEVLFILAILSILAAIVYASAGGARESARDKTRISDLSQIELALRIYKDTNSGYPAAPGGVVVGEGMGLDADLADYFNTLPTDPRTGNTGFDYFYDSDHDCAVAGNGVSVLFARTTERSGNANWDDICGTNGGDGNPSSETYGIILR